MAGLLFDGRIRVSADYELGSAVRAVDRTAAALLRELERPRRLPARWGAIPRPQRDRVIAALVLDGVLEVEWGGTFVSGPAAHSLFFTGSDAAAPASRLARLSLEAIRYAAALDLDDARALGLRLYRFNTFPASPNARRRWPDSDAVAAFLRLDRLASDAKVVASAAGAWFGWRVRGARRPSRGEPRYKLYVSPCADCLEAALHEVIARLADVRACECKVGRDLRGLLRPDKLIVYFRTLRALQVAAKLWARALAGTPVQGVPFTADIGGDGLLSWGLDPPGRGRVSRRGHPVSWREWVTGRLADALVAARRARGAAVAPSRYALDRVALDGVDRCTWAPSPWLRRSAAFG